MRKLFVFVLLICCNKFFDYGVVKKEEFKRYPKLKQVYKDSLEIKYPFFVNGFFYFLQKNRNSDISKLVKFDGNQKEIIKTGEYVSFNVNKDGSIFALRLNRDSLCFEIYYYEKDSSFFIYTSYKSNSPFYFINKDSCLIFFANGWFRKMNLQTGEIEKIYPDNVAYFSIDSTGSRCVYYLSTYKDTEEVRILDINRRMSEIIGDFKCGYVFLKGNRLFLLDFEYTLKIFDLLENKILNSIDIRPYRDSYFLGFVSMSSDFNNLVFPVRGNEIWMLENLNDL